VPDMMRAASEQNRVIPRRPREAITHAHFGFGFAAAIRAILLR